ncbi:MAG: RNA pyrophosphohydrolase [Sinobacterium sp.]|nr:RNA pyrophosphohydrolase [Sinobacterium sp.]
MIDENGFRSNVGIIIANANGQVLWAKRLGQNAWQFPQGGINDGETPEQAMYRELQEEVGLEPSDVEVVASTRGWLRYRLPQRMLRHGTEPLCIGQKQKWFLLRLLTDDARINVQAHHEQEFDHWEWVSYWYPLEQVVSFKRDVYRRALKELSATHSRLVMLNTRVS